MQFAPDRYPVQDMEFNVSSTLGIVARELEQQGYANMLKTVPSESPAFWMLLKNIFKHSDMSDREEMLAIIDQMTKSSLQKQAQPQPDPLVELKKMEIQTKAQLEQAKLAQKADQDNKELQLNVKRLEIEVAKLQLAREDMVLDAQIALSGQEQDSMVTATQMAGTREDAKLKAAVQLVTSKSRES